jgi:hypothetical protein
MTPETRLVHFAGLDPVPIGLTMATEADDDTIIAAAGLPSSVFMETVRPYRLQPSAPDEYALVLGPQGFGAVLLEALQWLAHVTAAGIVGTVTPAQVAAFVDHYLEQQRPDWRFEEVTEHAETFIRDRYQRALDDAVYRQGLEQETSLATTVLELQAWVIQRG